jgi:hypothetical protein
VWNRGTAWMLVMYQHTQKGWLLLTLLGAFTVGLGFAAIQSGQPEPLIPAGILLVVLALFCCLTVRADDKQIEVSFGPGLIRKKLRLEKVQTCQPVKNHWWFGWGIRCIGRRKWLFNVSGLDAVELVMKDGAVYRVGTDEPDQLSRFIQSRLGKAA